MCRELPRITLMGPWVACESHINLVDIDSYKLAIAVCISI